MRAIEVCAQNLRLLDGAAVACRGRGFGPAAVRESRPHIYVQIPWPLTGLRTGRGVSCSSRSNRDHFTIQNVPSV